MLIERREMGAAEGAPGSDSEMKANLARVLLSDLVVIEVGRRSLGGHCCWTEIGEKKFAVKDIHDLRRETVERAQPSTALHQFTLWAA